MPLDGIQEESDRKSVHRAPLLTERFGFDFSSGTYCDYEVADLRLTQGSWEFFLEVPGGRIIPVGDPKADRQSECRRHQGPISEGMRKGAQSKVLLPSFARMKGGVYFIELPDGRGVAKITRPFMTRHADRFSMIVGIRFSRIPQGLWP